MASRIKGSQHTNEAKSLASFAQLIRRTRRQLDFTAVEVARQIRTSPSYIVLLESGKRHPSDRVIRALAELLDLDARDLFMCANPHMRDLMAVQTGRDSAWDTFRGDHKLHRLHRIGSDEMKLLAHIRTLGKVESPHDFIYILNTIRLAWGH